MFNANPTDDDSGFADSSTRVGLCRDVTLLMYKYNGDKMPKKCVFYSTWLETVSEVAVNYTDSNSIKYSAQFKWDYWLLKDS